jgi:hypothetical protein
MLIHDTSSKLECSEHDINVTMTLLYFPLQFWQAAFFLRELELFVGFSPSPSWHPP